MVRVVSLLPATTELVAAMGAADRLVGRSHECDHPPGVTDLPVVSRPRREPVGTSAEVHRGVVDLLREVLSIYRVDEQALRVADPDVVITQDLCRVCAVDESAVAAAVHEHLDHPAEVVTCSPLTLDDVLADVTRIGDAIGLPTSAARLREELADAFDRLRHTAPAEHPRVAVLEWADPLMGAGNWAPELVELAGGVPVLATHGGHTPFASPEELAAADPDVVVVAPCGYDLARAQQEGPLLEAVPGWADLRAVRGGRVAFLDGSAYLNRPGPRLVDTAEHLRAILTGAPPTPGVWDWYRPRDRVA